MFELLSIPVVYFGKEGIFLQNINYSLEKVPILDNFIRQIAKLLRLWLANSVNVANLVNF